MQFPQTESQTGPQPTLPPVVYHYCTVETFFNIISNHSLRLSDIEKSNDFMEKKWAIQQCLMHIRSNLNNPAYPCHTNPQTALALLDEMEQQFTRYNTMILAACFSSERDLLSQWRGYGDNGDGVCIGINSGSAFTSSFARAEKYFSFEEQNKALPKHLFFHPVQYTTEEVQASVMTLFCSYLNWLPLERSIPAAAQELVRISYPALPFFKSNAFSEEREWRLVYYPRLPAPPYDRDTFDEQEFQRLLHGQRVVSQLDQFQMDGLHYRLRKNNLVPYRDLHFDCIEGNFIKSVTIGPKCPLDMETVKLFLEGNGIPISMQRIYRSNISYR